MGVGLLTFLPFLVITGLVAIFFLSRSTGGIMKILMFILGLFGIGKKKASADDIFLNKANYRTDDQDKAVHYFSDRNKKGCLATIKGCFKKKPQMKIKSKNKGCFPKKLGFMSDKDYDALVASMISKLDVRNKGLKKLGFDDSQVEKTIEFGSYVWYNDDGVVEGYREGEDGKYRTNIFRSTQIFFTRSQVAIYRLTFNTDWEKHDEDTFEYHYKDIVALSTVTNNEDHIDPYKGETVWKCYKNELVLQVPGDSFKISLGNKTTAEEEASIQAMKAMLREKKA